MNRSLESSQRVLLTTASKVFPERVLSLNISPALGTAATVICLINRTSWLFTRCFSPSTEVRVSDVAPREALGHTRGVGLRVARPGVDPGAAVEPGGVHHERVTFPASDGITEPCRLRIIGERAAVKEHLTKRLVRGGFVQQHNQ